MLYFDCHEINLYLIIILCSYKIIETLLKKMATNILRVTQLHWIFNVIRIYNTILEWILHVAHAI